MALSSRLCTAMLAAALAAALAPKISLAADIGAVVPPAAPAGGAVVQAPVVAAPLWTYGGRHWRGHHDLTWRIRDPNFSYFTYGWGQPWYVTPRHVPARPRVVMPAPVAPAMPTGVAPPAWSAQWYAYCADRYRSFDPVTGLYTTRGGRKAACR